MSSEESGLTTNLIMILIPVAIVMLVGLRIMSAVDEAYECPTGYGSTECMNVKSNSYTFFAIVPVFMVVAIFLFLRINSMPDFLSNLFGSNQPRGLPFYIKIMLFLRIAKVKEEA